MVSRVSPKGQKQGDNLHFGRTRRRCRIGAFVNAYRPNRLGFFGHAGFGCRVILRQWCRAATASGDKGDGYERAIKGNTPFGAAPWHFRYLLLLHAALLPAGNADPIERGGLSKCIIRQSVT